MNRRSKFAAELPGRSSLAMAELAGRRSLAAAIFLSAGAGMFMTAPIPLAQVLIPAACAQDAQGAQLSPSTTDGKAGSSVTAERAQRGAESNGIKPNYLAAAAENGVARWPSSRLPIKVWIKDAASVPGYRESFKTAVEAALKDWTEATNNRIRFTPGAAASGATGAAEAAAENGAITVSWTNNPKDMMSSTEGGHALVIPDGEGILKANIILLTKQLDGKPISDAHAKHIALHEIGHALGILGHSQNSGDIMYGVINPGDTRVSLSQPDINTIQTLYSPAGDSFANKAIDLEKMTHVGDQSSPVMRSVRLNAEAAIFLQQNKFADAMHKLEEAHSLDPTNNLITGNLGSVYANIAAFAVMMQKLPDADSYFQKSIPLLEKSGNTATLKTVLNNYATILRAKGRMSDAEKLDAKARKLP
jgi:predicted Zn-dependent protease